MKLNGKTVVVTGAANGIGKGLATRLSHEGATVVCADINADAALSVAKEIGCTRPAPIIPRYIGPFVHADMRQNLCDSLSHRGRATLHRVHMIFLNVEALLNLMQSIGEILAVPLRLYFGLKSHAARDKAKRLSEALRLPERYLDRFTRQLSGG
ncbi:SDR family NAD(P)-dependent oxidoreductase [Ruegeria sp. Ofav3-42]|uniref:SDR family NAD(P)-dependent oxidoreductase n=1 Tax=Ruegeria sp. Ofav3-42 TaxID=2917759 RepID=UPI001EF48599|nr:SDR family NAD(P)-dependent oxidoreductase [Ruegeria sp. Ofav3-42]MCG7521522.1 SDR family NAD(P)-dependent oxidoreductase [Ruegeria sp. Ofav3-42]